MNVPISPLQIQHDAAVVSPGSKQRLHPWQRTPPPSLYKYYPPERFHVLTDCLVRFSQREVFDDQLDLRPEVASFGTAEEMRAFMNNDPVLSQRPQAIREAAIAYILNTPGRERELINQTRALPLHSFVHDYKSLPFSTASLGHPRVRPASKLIRPPPNIHPERASGLNVRRL